MNVTPELETRLGTQAEVMAQRASANLEEWGGQTQMLLITCMAEELGEIAEAVLRVGLDWEKTKAAMRDAEDEARDLGALCLQMALLCESGQKEPDDE